MRRGHSRTLLPPRGHSRTSGLLQRQRFTEDIDCFKSQSSSQKILGVKLAPRNHCRLFWRHEVTLRTIAALHSTSSDPLGATPVLWNHSESQTFLFLKYVGKILNSCFYFHQYIRKYCFHSKNFEKLLKHILKKKCSTEIVVSSVRPSGVSYFSAAIAPGELKF
jgi:hypothetical protein